MWGTCCFLGGHIAGAPRHASGPLSWTFWGAVPSPDRDPLPSSTHTAGVRGQREAWVFTPGCPRLPCPGGPLLCGLPQGTRAHAHEDRTCHSKQHPRPHTAEEPAPPFSLVLSVAGLSGRKLASPSAIPRASRTVMSPGLARSSDVRWSGRGLPERRESRGLPPRQGQLVCNTSLNCSNTEPCL